MNFKKMRVLGTSEHEYVKYVKTLNTKRSICPATFGYGLIASYSTNVAMQYRALNICIMLELAI